MKTLSTLVVMAAIILAILFFGSPYYTASQLQKAYESNDGAALIEHIDFEQLQPNIKTQLQTRFNQTLDKYPIIQTLGASTITPVATDVIEHAVSNAVTADNVEQLVNTQGQVNGATKELAAAWAIASDKVDLRVLVQDIIGQGGDIDMEALVASQMAQLLEEQARTASERAQAGADSNAPELSYCGINCFNISGMVKGYWITLTLQRQGFVDWQVVNVVLP